MNVKIICMLIAGILGLPFVASAADAPKEDGLLMYLPFDGSADAAASGGDAKPLKQNNMSYAPGLKNDAVVFKKDVFLNYASAGNLDQNKGTVCFWFKPNWSSQDMSSVSLDYESWHFFFGHNRNNIDRIGSGALWFWTWGKVLRTDVSDITDTYKVAYESLVKDNWYHLAFNWDGTKHDLFLNGVQVTGGAKDGDSELKPKRSNGKKQLKFDNFFVGNHNGGESADGLIDEMKIYNRALTPEEIRAQYGQVLPIALSVNTPDILPGTKEISWDINNRSKTESLKGGYEFNIIDSEGKSYTSGALDITLAPGAKKTIRSKASDLASGPYTINLSGPGIPEQLGKVQAAFTVLREKNPYIGAVGSEMKTTPILTLHIPDLVGKDVFTSVGAVNKRTLDGVEYLEAGEEHNDRFAIRVELPEANVPYWVEWTYPDDKYRTMDVIAQSVTDPSSDYSYQTGVFCGDEYPNTNKMKTFASIYWAQEKDIAFVFTTARGNAPAAVADLKISRLDGPLPEAYITKPESVDKWNRSFGIYFEDPALNYDYGMPSGSMPDFENTLDRMIAYMKWTGQNFFAYPGAWYHGLIGENCYYPREHPKDYLEIILRKFEQQDMEFMPTINLHSVPLPEGIDLEPANFKNGYFHNTPVMIENNGEPNPGRFHGSPPIFNPLHPKTQEYVDGMVDELLERCGDSPAFKGVILHLTKHTPTWFGTIEAGYNDYNIDAFEKDTGIKVPVSREAPDRGKQYFEWLMANAAEKWVDWRCQKIAEWHLRLAKKIKAKRPDLKLGVFSYNPTFIEGNTPERAKKPNYVAQVNLESGLNPKYYSAADNIIMCTTVYPADYRWSSGGHGFSGETPDNARHMYESFDMAQNYAILKDAPFTWINIHDRYFESAVGAVKQGENHWSLRPGKGKPLPAKWLHEMGWRVSTLNPGERYFLEQFLFPLKHQDILGFSKGGFLIGTLGVEAQLKAFAQAYRPLPAMKFSEIEQGNKNLALRVLSYKGETWFYIVNTGSESADITLSFDKSVKSYEDLVSGKPVEVNAKESTIKMEPYQLRSFMIKGEVKISSAGK